MYVFHNTWYLRSTYVKKGRIPGLSHFNNAIVYARSADRPPGLVDDDKPMFGADFLADWKPGDATQAPRRRSTTTTATIHSTASWPA